MMKELFRRCYNGYIVLTFRQDSLKAPALFSELTKKDLASMGVSGGGSDKRDSKKEERRKKAAGGGSKGGGGGGGGGSGGGGRGGRESKTQKVGTEIWVAVKHGYVLTSTSQRSGVRCARSGERD